MSRAIANLISMCIDSMMRLAPMARGNLAELLDPAKKRLEPHEIEGILHYDKAVSQTLAGEDNPLSNDVRDLLAVIENHKKTQESGMEESFGKMQEALSAKKQLSDEISEFEQKQWTMINLTLIVIVICSFCFCGCYFKQRFSKKEPEVEATPEYEIIGTPEEQAKKAESMEKIVKTLILMDEEIVKMREELESLKKR